MVAGETIAAIATAPGRGGVAIVRISGPDAFVVAERLTGRPPQPGRVCVAPIRQSDNSNDRIILDQGVVLAFRAPHSYTGEDVVEVQCHGGTVTPRRVLEACFAAGARLARRGEFTQRAFLNGKLDYDQAASVLDLVDARTDRAADAALEGLAGRRRQACRELYEETLSVSTDVEHALDIDEGELPPGFLPEVGDRVLRLQSHVSAVLRRVREGKILREGALVVLAGPPNVGKSSLMNALLAENRAIVSDVPGTTRDSIEEWLDLDGWPIRLVDTAGLRETGDAIEAEGVRRARELAERAEIVLSLSEAHAVAEPIQSAAAVIRVVTKSDLLTAAACADLAARDELVVSARTGFGLEALKGALCRTLDARCGAGGEVSDVTEADQAVLLDVRNLLKGLGGQADLVLLGNGLRQVAERLGEMIGATYSSDLLDRLFSRFCVGK